MKICFLTDSILRDEAGMINGAQVQVSLLAREMRRRGHEVCVVAGGARRGRAADYAGMPVHEYRSHRWAPVAAATGVYGLLRQLEPDVVYTRGRSYLAGVAAASQRHSSGVFVWASNNEDGCERWKALSGLWKGPRPVWRKILRTPVDLAADLVCDAGVHRADACVCQTTYQRDRLQVVHGREGTIIRSLQVAERPLAPRDTPPMVLWVGRVAPDRRPEAFVELAAALSDADCDFVLVGPADSVGYRDRVLAPAAGLARFRYLGAVSFNESWEWIARAAILVNTHPREGVSNALVQAWVCGTPTIVLSFDPDGLIQGSGAGLLSGDMATLARDVRRLVDDDEARSACGRRARGLAEREFSRSAVGDAYETMIRKLT
jgi:glycosyltransferase involved in cell wall biosynthesis